MRSYKRLVLVFLFLFASVTLFINFFHTEKSLQVNESCPACQLQSSIPNLSHYDAGGAGHPPNLCLLEVLSTVQISSYNHIFIDNPASRSPPSI